MGFFALLKRQNKASIGNATASDGARDGLFVDENGILYTKHGSDDPVPVGMPAELIPALRPVIEIQPVDVAVVPGSDVDVSLKVGRFNHLPFTIRWERRSGSDWIAYADSNSETFRITNVLAATQVRSVVANAYGEEISNTIIVTPLSITLQPHSSEFYEGGSATFTVVTNVPPSSIQWRSVIGGVPAPIVGATSSTLMISGLSKSLHHGMQVNAEIRAGTGTLVTSTVTLSVWNPSAITDVDIMQLDANAGVFTDTAGLSAVSYAQNDGELIGTWRSRNAAYNFVAEVSGHRPQLKIAGGQRFIRFAGTHVLSLQNSPFLRKKDACVAVFAVRINTRSLSGFSSRFFQIQTNVNNTRFDLGESFQSDANRYLTGRRRLDADGSVYMFAVGPNDTEWAIVTAVCDYAIGGSAGVTLYVNGVSVGYGTVSPVGQTSDTNSSRICIGGTYNGTDLTNAFNGDVAEFMSFNSLISTADIRRCEEYLAAKHNISLANLEFHV